MIRAWVLGVVSVAGLIAACAQPELSSDPLPVVDDTKRAKEPAATAPEAPKTTQPDWANDAGAPGSPDSGVGRADSGATKSCAPTNTCAAPRKSSVASIPGDDALIPLEMRGSTSEFVSVRITEESSLWYDLKVKATLTSPPGTNFDLLVYVPAADTAITACDNFSASSSNTSGEDVVRNTWSDSTLSDDSRTVVFEIRHVSGDCSDDPDARWVLKIQGYTE